MIGNIKNRKRGKKGKKKGDGKGLEIQKRERVISERKKEKEEKMQLFRNICPKTKLPRIYF